MSKQLTSVEICAGAGGQALGLHRAGFHHRAAVEIDNWAVETLRANHPEWNIVHQDVHQFDGAAYEGVDLFAGGVPCPPFSIAGKQLGADDERDLFPRAMDLVDVMKPRAILLENVKGLGQKRFEVYRSSIIEQLESKGYTVGITYRQLDYWARTKLVGPSVRTATGSGSQRLYSFRDLVIIKIVKGLLDTGISLPSVRKSLAQLEHLN